MKNNTIKKSELKKEYYERVNASNILKSQNIIIDEKNIDTFLLFFNCEIKDDIAKECNKKETVKQYTDVLQFITELKLHERYTISIIKSIASNPKHFCCKSCLDIVNSGYTQHILEDIKSNVFITLFEMIQEKKVWLENNNLVFDTYINSKDKETSYFFNLYKTVEKTFYNEKKHNESRYIKIKYDLQKHGKKAYCDENGYLCDKFGNAYLKGCKMEYLDSYNNDITSANGKDYKEFLYNVNGENSLENVAYREDIKQFFSTIKKQYPKYYSDFCGIFECLYKGYTYKETASALNIQERRIKYLIPLFREKFDEFMVDGINIKKSINDNLYCDRTINTSTTYYINRTRYTVVTPTIKKVQVQEDIYKHSIKNYDYDIPQWQREQWQREKEEQQKQLLDNVTQHINIVDVKNKNIVVINQDGQKLYTCALKTKDYKKFAKKHGLEIL